MARKIVIEKGSRIQYCNLAEVLEIDADTVTYRVIGEEENRTTSTRNFDRWYWEPTEKILSKIHIEREKLLKELAHLDFIEKSCQNEL